MKSRYGFPHTFPLNHFHEMYFFLPPRLHYLFIYYPFPKYWRKIFPPSVPRRSGLCWNVDVWAKCRLTLNKPSYRAPVPTTAQINSLPQLPRHWCPRTLTLYRAPTPIKMYCVCVNGATRHNIWQPVTALNATWCEWFTWKMLRWHSQSKVLTIHEKSKTVPYTVNLN